MTVAQVSEKISPNQHFFGSVGCESLFTAGSARPTVRAVPVRSDEKRNYDPMTGSGEQVRRPREQRVLEGALGCVRFALLRGIELWAGGVRSAFDWRHSYRRHEGEVQHGFARQLDLLTFRGRLHAAAEAATRCRSDSSSLAATRDSADDGTDNGSSANFLGRVFGAAAAFALVLIGLQVVGLPSDGNSIKLKNQQRLSSKFARTLDANHMTFHLVAGRNRNFALCGERRVERGFEGLALLRGLGIDRIDQANRNRCPGGYRQLFRRRGRGWRCNRRRGRSRSRTRHLSSTVYACVVASIRV